MDKGLLLLAFLIVIGRPVSVFLALAFSKDTTMKERTFLAFLAPRGIVAAAVTSVFALEFEEAALQGRFGEHIAPVIAAQSHDLVALVFLVIVGSVSVYGLAAAPLARRLGLASKNSNGILFAGADVWSRLAAKSLQDEGHRVLLVDTNFSNVAAAKMLGLEAHRANILSDFVELDLNLNGIGHLVAGTANDEVNSMAAYKFIHQFSRAGVWQLAPSDRNGHSKKAATDDLRSRICFAGGPTFDDIAEAVAAGAVVKKTQITDVFDYAKFLETNPKAIVMFLQDGRGLRPAPAGLSKVTSGTAIYMLVPTSDPT